MAALRARSSNSPDQQGNFALPLAAARDALRALCAPHNGPTELRLLTLMLMEWDFDQRGAVDAVSVFRMLHAVTIRRRSPHAVRRSSRLFLRARFRKSALGCTFSRRRRRCRTSALRRPRLPKSLARRASRSRARTKR